MPAFTVIDHTELVSGANSYTKSSIPSSYDHLYFVASVRTDGSVYTDYAEFEFNADTTTSNYSYTILTGNTATPASSRGTTAQAISLFGGEVCGASTTADTFSTVKMWIPNYANTTGFKSATISVTTENASTTNYQWGLWQGANLWHSTAAINELKYYVYDIGGDNFVQYSTFTLYGVTGA